MVRHLSISALPWRSGSAWAIRAPKIYEAKTLILVEPQAVPGDVVKPIVSKDMSSRIATIKQQITSRSNLEKIIGQFQLFETPEQQKLFMEDKLESLRKRIMVNVTQTRGSGEAFSIAFQASDAEQTMKVANALSAHFIEANLQTREEQAEGTSQFIDAELETMRGKMEQVEGELREFRKLHMGELPDQMPANLGHSADAFRRQMEERKDRLRDERSRLMIVDNEIEQLRVELQREQRFAGASAEAANRTGKPVSTLQQRYEELSNLRSTYTENHPDVIRLKKKIEEMEKALQSKVPSAAEETGDSIADQRAEAIQSKPLQEKMRQRMAIQADIGKVQQDVVRIEQEIRQYQKRIERTPQREGELIALKRDYDNIQNTYKSLLNRKLEADIAVNMEKKKKGEQFRILDYAKMPEKPLSPDPRKIFAISLAAGLGVGFGILFLFDMLNASDSTQGRDGSSGGSRPGDHSKDLRRAGKAVDAGEQHRQHLRSACRRGHYGRFCIRSFHHNRFARLRCGWDRR